MTVKEGYQHQHSQSDELCELAAALAHEIKNPAALALAHVSLLRQRDDLVGIGDTCDHIEESLEEICSLVQDMLLVTYGIPPAYEFDLEDMFIDMLEAYQAAWPQITFNLDTPGEGLMYHGEEVYIKMIFSNLLKNAIEAIGVCGSIKLSLYVSRERIVYITIQDSGSSQERLKPHASGLGLAICRWLLARVGGHLEMAMKPECGCRATVALPV